MKQFFKRAVPVWADGKENEMNCCIELQTAVSGGNNILRIAGATFYQVFLCNELLHFGPARKAEGYAGVDELSLPEVMGSAEILIRVIGYNCRSYNGASGTSFVQAEIENEHSGITAATGTCGFDGYITARHLQRVMRYSYQRQFAESWNYEKEREKTVLAEVAVPAALVERNVPYGEYEEFAAGEAAQKGSWYFGEDMRLKLFPYLINPEENFTHFPLAELESHAYEEYLRTRCVYKKDVKGGSIGHGGCAMYAFNEIQSGFFKINLRAYKPSRILLAYAEQLDSEGRPSMKALNAVNVIEWIVPEGEWELISLEPYTAKYVEILVMEGEVLLNSLSIKEAAFPKDGIKKLNTEDTEIKKVYDAAIRTFRHNVLDIYMDCPSRERAGWLFDSYYTAKAEWELTGDTKVERAFLDNYILGGELKDKSGMLNMCYPSDVFSGTFIPQWAMWYAVEVYEYVTERGGASDKEKFRDSVMGVCGFLRKYENEYELLERLPGWNFVEWSALNERVWDVSWATNMLYAEMLKLMGELYDERELSEKSVRIKKVIEDKAYNGRLFCDRAVRNEDGVLENTKELSETTQYYALRFGIADAEAEEYSEPRHMVFDVFGAHSAGDDGVKTDDGIEKADAMPGLYLRMELLKKYKMYDRLFEEIKEYFLPMAQESGTLWERKSGTTSRDHGFASYAAAVISEVYRDKKMN
ncbi:MAG: hypothetical protein ACI4DY_11100 [Monoglobaceae bacterium]